MGRESADTIDDTVRPQRTVERLIAKCELIMVGQGTLRRVCYDSILAYLSRHRDDEAA
jgi:hypothetical protein